MTASASTTIVLIQVKCINTSEVGHDEVYIHYSIDGGHTKRYPDDGYVSMEEGETWDTGLYLTFKQSALVELYDSDTLGDDLLGQHTYTPSETQPETVTVSNTNGAKYNLSTEAAP